MLNIYTLMRDGGNTMYGSPLLINTCYFLNWPIRNFIYLELTIEYVSFYVFCVLTAGIYKSFNKIITLQCKLKSSRICLSSSVYTNCDILKNYLRERERQLF